MDFQVTISDGSVLEFDGEASFTIEHGAVLRIMDPSRNRTLLYSPNHWRTVQQIAHVPHAAETYPPPLSLSDRLHPSQPRPGSS